METIEKLIGKKVKDARLKLGLSQTDLAKNAKTSLTTINRLEKGHQFPHSSTITEIAKALNIEVATLYSSDKSTEPQKESSDRAQSILNIQSELNLLSDGELKQVTRFISDLKMRRVVTGKSSKDVV